MTPSDNPPKFLLWLAAAALLTMAAVCLSFGRPAQAISPGPAEAPASDLLLPDPSLFDGFFAKLLELENGTGRPRVCIMQLGDSHTALDQMSGELRVLFQSKFGDAGRGYVLPGRIHRYYYPTHLEVGIEGEWTLSNTLFSNFSRPVGLSGFRVTGTDSGARLLVKTKAGPVSGSFSDLKIHYLARPRNGTMRLRIDGAAPRLVATAGPRTGQTHFAATLPDAPHSVEISPVGDGPIELFGMSLERRPPGVIYENLGVGGTEINLLTRLDAELVKQDLQERSPSLILVAFGTNESFYEQIPYDYRQAVRNAVALLRQGAPDVPILLLGPPDVNRMPKPCPAWLRENQIDVADLACMQIPALPVPAAGFEPSRQNCAWSPTPLLEPIRNIQREIAFSENCGYWEWADLMDGACGMHRWSLLPQPLGRTDHIHLTQRGYRYTAQALFRSLMDAYEQYKMRREMNAP